MKEDGLQPKDFIIDELGVPDIPSPVKLENYVDEKERFLYEIDPIKIFDKIRLKKELVTLERSGPRRKIFFEPSKTRAAIVTCGGLCPGINNVIRSITLELLHQYKIQSVIGYRYGFKGIADKSIEPIQLNVESVAGISELGGSILASSRGPQNIKNMIERLEEDCINLLFIIGGDGSLRGAHAISQELKNDKKNIGIVCVPKTIDNDISFISKSFGFQSAYSKAVEAINCVHTESLGAPNCVGIVKVMGRHSGAIAAYASISSHDVNFCLIPEINFTLEGPNGLYELLVERIKNRSHAVIVVAEGAAQDLMNHGDEKDASGNVKLADVGIWLRDKISAHFGDIAMEFNIKYIDPSYIIRSIAATPDDAMFCTILGQYAVHAGMSGRTGIIIGQRNHLFANIPIKVVVSTQKKINTGGSIWKSVLESTGQKLKTT